MQLRERRRVDGVGRPKFDFHTGEDGRVACPAEGCQASLSLETLAALLPPEENQAARNRPAFDCVACGERVARRDTIALHRQLPYHHVRACVKIKFWSPHAIDAM